MSVCSWSVVFWLLAVWHVPVHAQALNVVYPQIEERPASDYGYQVLALALAKSGVPYRLQLSRLPMNLKRAQAEIQAGTVSVVDFGTSRDAEQNLRAVYFPIDRGLSGYRLFIIHRESASVFAKVRALGDLRSLTAGQGPGWPDAQILSAAGIPVVTAQFERLFAMVDARRFDFYPLGVEEVYGFLDRYRAVAPNSIVEPELAIHYPFARLFFVRSDNAALHDALLTGLKRAFADGSLQHLLDDNLQFSEGLRQSQLKHRRIIEIDNPLLSDAFRAIPKSYFLNP